MSVVSGIIIALIVIVLIIVVLFIPLTFLYKILIVVVLIILGGAAWFMISRWGNKAANKIDNMTNMNDNIAIVQPLRTGAMRRF